MRRVWQAAAFPMVFAIVVLLLGSCFVLGAGTNDTNSTTTSNNRPEEPRRALVWPAHALHNTLTIQRFGLFSRVALDTTVSSEYSVLPQHYWIWLQVSHILNTSCPDCSWTEVGGPGLIAFRVSARPWNSSRVPVPAAWVPSDTAWHHMLAGMTIDINGYLANVTTLLPPPVNGSSSSTTSGSSTGASSTAGSSSGTAAAELPPVDSYALSRRVLMLVDFCYGCRPRVNLATLLLRSGRVFAMIVLIAPRKSHFDVGSSDGGSSSSSGGAEGQEAYECTEDLLAPPPRGTRVQGAERASKAAGGGARMQQPQGGDAGEVEKRR